MTGIYLSVPVACFRRGLAREYLETELLPPPATCYGFLLSLVGETDRHRHIGVRIAPVLLGEPGRSVVLRTVWRIKSKHHPPGGTGNTRPDFQQLLTGVELVIWLDSSGEQAAGPDLETRVAAALDAAGRGGIDRFGGLSLGESTHLVNDVSLITPSLHDRLAAHLDTGRQVARRMSAAPQGNLSTPVWVDHVGSARTRHAVAQIVEEHQLQPPAAGEMPRIESPPDRPPRS